MNVLITGAAGGIGRALVAQYLAEGATVVAATLPADRPPPSAPGAGRLLPIPLDVTDPAALAEAERALAPDVPHLDVIFNCAGVVGRRDRFEDFSPEDFLAVLRVNTLAPILVARAFLPLLQAAAHGRVLTFTSRTAVLFEGARAGANSGYGYATSKAAQNRLLPMLAADLRQRGVTAVGVDPGFVETDMTRGFAGNRHLLRPEICAEGLRAVARSLTPAHAGMFLRWNGRLCRWHAPAETAEDLQLMPPTLPDPFVLAPAPPQDS